MATADEILATMEDDPTGYNAVCVVDFASRKITVPPALAVLGVESDDDVRRINFVMPSTYGDYNLNDFEININYLNAGGEGDIYTVDDQVVVDNTITFTWLVGRTAFMYKGDVKFIVCLKKRGDTGAVEKELNTTVATTEVLEGLEVGDSIVEHNPDVIEAILLRLNSAESLSLNLTSGSAKGSVRNAYSASEGSIYTMGEYATALGLMSKASGRFAFAEGQSTTASGQFAHAEGGATTASGMGSHAEGNGTVADHYYAHAEGDGAKALAYASHAEGEDTTVNLAARCGHAEGYGTVAQSEYSHVQGKYNIPDAFTRYAHIVGNGTAETPGNAHTVDWWGNAWFAGNVYVHGSDQDNSEKLVTMQDVLSELICIVNMTAESDGSMSTFTFLTKDKTFADVKRVFDNGGYVACRVRWTAGAAAGMTLEGHLVSYTVDGDESAFVFAFGANPMVMFKSDDTVIIAND